MTRIALVFTTALFSLHNEKEGTMKSISAVLLATLFALAGCVSTHQVDSARPDTWVPEVHEKFLGEEIDIRTTDGTSYTRELLQLSSDSLRLRTDESASIVEKPLEQVVYLGQSSNAAGPILGGLTGILVGGFAGLALGASTHSLEATAEGGALGIFLGGAAGIIIGSEATRVDQYVLHHTPSDLDPAQQEREANVSGSVRRPD